MLPVSGAEQLNTSEAQCDPPHDLAQRRILEVGQPGAVLQLGQEQVPQLLGAGLLLQFLENSGWLPAAAGIELLLVALLVGIDVPVHEGGELLLQRHDLGRVLEIHGCPPLRR